MDFIVDVSMVDRIIVRIGVRARFRVIILLLANSIEINMVFRI